MSAPENGHPHEVGTANTLWAWLIVALPVVTLLSTIGYLVHVQTIVTTFLAGLSASEGRPHPADLIAMQMSLLLDPWYFALAIVGWASGGVYAWFSYRDVHALEQRGFQNPFHWAWSLLSPAVYIIGRHVVVRRRGGKGAGPLMVMIAVQTVGILLMAGWTTWFAFELVRAVLQMLPTR